jgi:cyclic pyranopterin phosphate synthase
MATLVDAFKRRISYLRISITDHCNLNCIYCNPSDQKQHLARDEILSFEEVRKVVQAGIMAGINKVRITGGEPLLRKGMVNLCQMLGALDGLEGLSITTNGVFLNDFAEPLFAAGIRRINVSLDSLKEYKFRRITGRKHLADVLSGLERSEEAGLSPIKINTVVMRGINDDEIEDFAQLTMSKPYHVRFIELMPTGSQSAADHRAQFVPVEEIISRVQKVGALALEHSDSCGPARICSLPGAVGKIGFIAPMSWHICGSCNRLRLTADGKLRPCLFSQEEVDLSTPLRSGTSLEDLAALFRLAAARKSSGQSHKETDVPRRTGRAMWAIGG